MATSSSAFAHERLRDAGEALIAAANEAGGRDNITVVLLRLEDVGFGDGAAARGGATMVGLPAVAAPSQPPDAVTGTHASLGATALSSAPAPRSTRRRSPRVAAPAASRPRRKPADGARGRAA